ncbi:MAG: hypothetical protein KA715_08015 [Xanthomonadaceae bacterium]|nr:hypothetical protein [Xanthomonadaceae bacterium]
MKKIILGLAMFSVVSAQAEVRVGDSATYSIYSGSESTGKTETQTVISIDDGEVIQNPSVMRLKKSEADSKILSERLDDIVQTEKALENCDPIPGMPVKGVKRNIVVDAGIFENTCHYVMYTNGIGEERYLSKDVPFFTVSRSILLQDQSVTKELQSFVKK